MGAGILRLQIQTSLRSERYWTDPHGGTQCFTRLAESLRSDSLRGVWIRKISSDYWYVRMADMPTVMDMVVPSTGDPRRVTDKKQGQP